MWNFGDAGGHGDVHGGACRRGASAYWGPAACTALESVSTESGVQAASSIANHQERHQDAHQTDDAAGDGGTAAKDSVVRACGRMGIDFPVSPAELCGLAWVFYESGIRGRIGEGDDFPGTVDRCTHPDDRHGDRVGRELVPGSDIHSRADTIVRAEGAWNRRHVDRRASLDSAFDGGIHDDAN